MTAVFVAYNFSFFFNCLVLFLSSVPSLFLSIVAAAAFVAKVLLVNFEVVRLGKALSAGLAAKWQLDRVGRIVLGQLVEIRVAFP